MKERDIFYPNLVFKFHDDPTVNKSKIVVLMRQVWMYAGKEMILRDGEGKTNLRGRQNVKMYR